MNVTNIHEAKTQFSRLVKRAIQGEEIIIGNAGRPVAKLVPYKKGEELEPRKPGLWKGLGWIADDFDEWPDDLAKAFGIDNKKRAKKKSRRRS